MNNQLVNFLRFKTYYIYCRPGFKRKAIASVLRQSIEDINFKIDSSNWLSQDACNLLCFSTSRNNLLFLSNPSKLHFKFSTEYMQFLKEELQ